MVTPKQIYHNVIMSKKYYSYDVITEEMAILMIKKGISVTAKSNKSKINQLVDELERCKLYLHTKYPKESSIFNSIEKTIKNATS